MSEEKNNKITLNELEQYLAKQMAKRRDEINKQNHVKDQKIGPQSDMEIELNGAAAEICVAKFLNLFPDLTIHPRHGGADLITHNGLMVDVKWTKYENGKLIAKCTKRPEDVDIYILCTGFFPKYSIKGWIRSNDLICEENLKSLGYVTEYIVEQDRLQNPDSICFYFHPFGLKPSAFSRKCL